ncbi:uncharacterized protein BDZ99DRAFT_469217 [Mytilinidion resinicola]|uniref:Uncharacterized protein n=1 Tax=Mytilinidion resinicola TaxID=574789 RepID=A0A6A6Y1M5_9PEZI|nr:uncharacterized protein BDZ99DRAFT_469217 [Mytilinidion resinicola]KAF2801914.1 hypothetical protein BDZ99DRAFT_469217 [Mytilinidion resinicola]
MEMDEDDWKEYGELLKREDGGSCPLSIRSYSVSGSVSAPGSTSSITGVSTTLLTVTGSGSAPTIAEPLTTGNPQSTKLEPLSPLYTSSTFESSSALSPSSTPEPSPTSSPSSTPPAPAYSCAPYVEDETECTCTPTNCAIASSGCSAVIMTVGQNGCDA